MTTLRSQMRYMNPYDLHKVLINEYVLRRPGDTKLIHRDSSKDKTDFDVIRENHKFLWEEENPKSWEAQFAKKYYDKLFKEYCIGDLSLYKENKIALRWRTEQEVVTGKGQFTCGNKRCIEQDGLRTWEVNFVYKEHGERKNALVKIRLCVTCSRKLNYHSKKREVKRLTTRKHKSRKKSETVIEGENVGECTSKKLEENASTHSSDSEDLQDSNKNKDESPWDNHKPIEVKTRDEEMESYLENLLL